MSKRKTMDFVEAAQIVSSARQRMFLRQHISKEEYFEALAPTLNKNTKDTNQDFAIELLNKEALLIRNVDIGLKKREIKKLTFIALTHNFRFKTNQTPQMIDHGTHKTFYAPSDNAIKYIKDLKDDSVKSAREIQELPLKTIASKFIGILFTLNTSKKQERYKPNREKINKVLKTYREEIRGIEHEGFETPNRMYNAISSLTKGFLSLDHYSETLLRLSNELQKLQQSIITNNPELLNKGKQHSL